VGIVKSINISTERGRIKTPVYEAEFRPDHGIVGDAHAGKWHRQISLLAQKSIDKMTAMGIEGLDAGKFAENITTEGIELHILPIGTVLKIGPCFCEVTQIGKTCHNECEIARKVGTCIMPKEGIFVRVLSGGIVRPGDPIEVFAEQCGKEGTA
jgi:MOSC domain-containing protein YiiM